MNETERQMLTAIHDSLIRLEPICKEVEANRKWREGNGLPGAKFQLWVMWGIFVIIFTDLVVK